mgnify:CR=1 FL=1
MRADQTPARRPAKRMTRRAALAFSGLLALSACVPAGMSGLSGNLNTNRPVGVALLVPGGSAEAGNTILATNLENAARLAVGDLDGVQIDLRIYNTQGDPAVAAQMARQAASDGAAIILGPVRSAEANAAGTAVAAAGINVLSFSNNPAIAGIVNALPEIADAARSSGANSVLFTADSAGALPVLAQLLPDNRIAYPQFQFMGITQWNVPPATLQLRGLQDGWFPLPDPALTAQFEARYTQAFGQAPHPIAGLAYDGIAAIGALIGTGSPDALSRASLTQGSGFVGVNGVFRFMPDGTNQRGLALATIRDNSVVILEPAPRSFAGTGF